jgi:hypothetical protein
LENGLWGIREGGPKSSHSEGQSSPFQRVHFSMGELSGTCPPHNGIPGPISIAFPRQCEGESLLSGGLFDVGPILLPLQILSNAFGRCSGFVRGPLCKSELLPSLPPRFLFSRNPIFYFFFFRSSPLYSFPFNCDAGVAMEIH